MILRYLVILTLVPSFVAANSILTRNTPGEPGTDGDARAMGMGGAVLGLADGSNGNSTNPAIPATLGKAGFILSFERNYIDYSLPYGSSVNISYDLPRVNLTIPSHYNTALTFGFNERYDQNYLVTGPIYVNGEYGGVKRVVGKGAIYSISGGVAAKLSEKLFVGLTGHYLFGAPRELWQRDYYIKGYSDTEITIESGVGGIMVAAGLAYRLTDDLSLGGFAEIPSTLNVTEKISTGYGDISENDHEFSLPIRAGIGAAYHLRNNLVTVADVRFTRWSSFSVDGNAVDNFRDTVEFRGGAEYRPSMDKKSFLLLKTPYRLGAFYEPWYDESRGKMAKIGASFGMGYTFDKNENSRLDLTFEYARRGSIEENGIKEDIFNLYMTLAGVETWLGKSAEE